MPNQKNTVDHAFHMAGEIKKEMFNKNEGAGQNAMCIHFAERKRNRDREARASTIYESERLYVSCFVTCVCACVYVGA